MKSWISSPAQCGLQAPQQQKYSLFFSSSVKEQSKSPLSIVSPSLFSSISYSGKILLQISRPNVSRINRLQWAWKLLSTLTSVMDSYSCFMFFLSCCSSVDRGLPFTQIWALSTFSDSFIHLSIRNSLKEHEFWNSTYLNLNPSSST